MSRFLLKCCSALSLYTLLLVAALPAQAETVSDVVKDFTPIEGTVVMAVGGEYLVDLDAASRLGVGDLLALVKPGPPVVHPVSGQVLGTLTEVQGYLEVTRVVSGYSYARLLAGAQPERGMPLRRFEGVAAQFVDATGTAEASYRQLRQQLPQLRWQEYSPGATPSPAGDPTCPTLVFTAEGQKLEVRKADGGLLHVYLLPPVAAATSAPAPVATPAPVTTAPRQTGFPGSRGDVPAGIVRTTRSERSNEFWRSPMLRGNPGGMALGRFSSDGGLQLAVVQPGELRIYPLMDLALGQPVTVAVPKSLTPLRLDSADLDGDGVEELYVTARRDDAVGSYVVAWQQGGYRVVKEGLPWLFHTLPQPDGAQLLAQVAGGALRLFEGAVVRVTGTPAAPVLGAPVANPPESNVLSFAPVQLDGKWMAAAFSRNDRLELHNERGQLEWRSDEVLGGSEAFMLYKDSAGASSGDLDHYYLPAPLAQAPGGEVLVPVNLGTRLGRMRTFNSSHVKGMTLQGGELAEAWRTRKQNGYLADMKTADLDGDGRAELVLLVIFQGGNILTDGQFGIVSYQLP